MFINYSDIPGLQNLFLDYVYEFENVSKFYKYNFRSKEHHLTQFSFCKQYNRPHRELLSEIIKDQYKDDQISVKTEKNISLLSDSSTLAVVTGQQLAILGGPLYTIYKIISAIKLAQHSTEQNEGYHFVPVFWLEGDDHDFEEIRSINILDESNSLQLLTYDDLLPIEENRGNIGNLVIKETIENFLNTFSAQLRDTEYKGDVLSLINSCYKQGETFKSAFRKLLFNLFDKFGLILFDPQDDKIKLLLYPLFKNEILNFRKHSEQAVLRSAELEELYHAQVKVRPVNLFMNYEKGRYLIEPTENTFRLKHKRVKLSEEELLKNLDENPSAFSPNVLLRPICQDFLFPTAFYVAGPGEVAYFAQVMPLYKEYGIPEPIIYPRSSATLIEKSVGNVLDKFHLSITDFFIGNEKVMDKIIRSLTSSDIDKQFDNAGGQVEALMDELKANLEDLDKTTADSSDKYKQKMLHYLEELKVKAKEAQKKKYEIALRQANRALINILPNGVLQEREMNYLAYANKYGLNFIEQLYDELQINKFEHQLINI